MKTPHEFIESVIGKNKIYTPEQKIALDNCIAIFLVGSHLYGLNTPTSDFDYEAVFIDDPEYIIGNKRCDEVCFSTNKSNTRNTSEDKDIKFYSLRKFLNLTKDGNPNKIEHLFIPDRNKIYTNEYWDEIERNKKLFLSLKIKHTFTGYASSQKSKLLTKKHRLEEYREFKEVLDKAVANGAKIIGDLDLLETVTRKTYDKENEKIIEHTYKVVKGRYKFIEYGVTSEGSDAIIVNQKTYNWGMDINKIHNAITHELNLYGGRTKSIDTYGADLKFASHIFRLYYEGLRLLKEGTLEYPLPEAKFILQVKKGEYTIEELLKRCDDFEQLFDLAYTASSLPHSPDENGINNLQMDIFKRFWKEKGLY